MCENKLEISGRRRDLEEMLDVLNWDSYADADLVRLKTKARRDLQAHKLDAMTTIALFFNTPWDPPIPLVWKLSARCPNLHINLLFSIIILDFSGLFVFEGDQPRRIEVGPYGKYYGDKLDDIILLRMMNQN